MEKQKKMRESLCSLYGPLDHMKILQLQKIGFSLHDNEDDFEEFLEALENEKKQQGLY